MRMIIAAKKEKKKPNNHTSNTIESRLKEIHNAKKFRRI